ncbi:polysaccharide biosynthesis/export family protein [Anaeromyxobacter diazotrophicus]|nr:SLBB domain-containing protein [Anaeromyxobacter diazotrophicus]
MTNKPFRRGLATFLAAQPIFWMSNVAYAQTMQAPGGFGASGAGGVTVPGPLAPADIEVMRGERGLASAAAPVAPVIDETIDPDKYICGPGDVLELNFWGVQNFKLRVTIDVEGRAFVSKVGYFALQGKTLTQARRVMRDSVARFYPRLSFDVTLAEPRTFLVQVVDDVARPGSYPSRAIERVAAAIGKAGGFGPSASKRRVEVRRRDGTVLTADLLLYTLTGDLKFNPYLLDGDVVRVPFEELAATIGGAVNRPGRYELVKTRDLAELVELGGGLLPSATQLLPITLIRRGQDDREDLKTFEFVAGKAPAIPLHPEDAVRIPSAAELQQSVVVVGAIAGAVPATAAVTPAVTADEAAATRRLPFVDGDTVRTLLERVGGVGPLADLTGAYILRAGRTIPVDLYALVMLRDFKADLPVELGDTLVIPFKRRNILVEGSVFAPGSYPYNPAFGVEQYLSLAGGRSRNAQSIDNVKLITPNGETKDYRPDLKIDPGSSLVVPERNFSRSEVVQIILAGAGIVLSGVAVVIAARK